MQRIRVTPDNIDESLRTLLGYAGPTSFDSETTGLEETDVPFALIMTVGGSHPATYYFDDRLIPGFWRNPLLAELLESERVWVAQNFKYDRRMMSAKGLSMNGDHHDIAIMARLLDNTFLSYSLENQSKREGGEQKSDVVKKYIEEHDLYETRTTRLGEPVKQPLFDKVPVDIMEEYACQDAITTLSLWDTYLGRMDSGDLKVFKVERAVTRICYDMERRGIRVDIPYTRMARASESGIAGAKKAEFKLATGLDYVNSAEHLCPIFEKLGEKIYYTKKGGLSLTDDHLSTYTTPLAKIVQDIRFFDKRVSTYYDSYINKADERDYVHPTMWQAGTRTGRFSYSDPNLQNIPKEDDADYKVRRCFIPSPGNIFLSFDYSQMEYRMMAAYANETQVIREVMNGADFHQATADMLGLPRKQAKTLNFAILYGAGLDKIAGMLGCTKDEAKRLKTKYFLALPKVDELVRNIIATGKSRGYVINWLGRKLRAEYEFAYALPNHLIQGGGADVVKCAMMQLAQKGLDHGLVLQVHDQLVWDLPVEQARDSAAQIKDIMENIWEKNGMKLAVDASWSDKSLAEEDMIKGLP